MVASMKKTVRTAGEFVSAHVVFVMSLRKNRQGIAGYWTVSPGRGCAK